MDRIDTAPVAGREAQIGLLLAMLDEATSEWRSEIGDVSEDAVVWQPFPGGHSIGALILHIADVEAHWLHRIAAGQARTEEELAALLSRETKQYQVQWPAPPAQPLSWYYAQQDAVRARTKRLLDGFDDPERLSTHRDAEFTLRWLFAHVVIHEAYHGGQAVLLALQRRKQANQA